MKSNFFLKNIEKYLAVTIKTCTFALAIKERQLSSKDATIKIGSVAQLNRASDYGSEGCGFESRRNHKRV